MMTKFLRLGATLAVLAALSACAALPGREARPAPVATSGAPDLAAGVWPQAHTDISPDPDIRFGALPNGLRYAIRRQAIPAGQAALNLHFEVGSLMEADDQQGLAHFLEHMAFNGSQAVPEGEMIKVLERLGLAFGADTNASTGFSETIYKLDLPRTDAETVDTSLMLFSETARALTIEPAAVDRERGVVLSEERARDTPAYRIYQARLGFLLPGQRLADRYPIGKEAILQTAPAARIRAFYEAYYRPERAVLVAVGDFDPDVMETKIRARFSDWRATGPAGGTPDLGTVAKRGTEARLAVEPGAPLSMQLAWVRPADRSPDSQIRRKRDLTVQLGFAVLNRRLSRMARAPEPPFLGAAGFRSDQEHAAELTMITVNAQPDQWRAALGAIDREQRRIVQFGVRQDELDREIEEVRASARAAAAGAATRRPGDLAAEILESLDHPHVVTSPAQDLAMFEAAVTDLKVAQVSDALRAAFKGQGPLLFMASPQPIPGGEAALLAELAASRKAAVSAQAGAALSSWPYEVFGSPGRVADTREVQDLDTVFVRFDNGVRLTIKPTKFRDDEVLVRVNAGLGMLSLPKDRPSFNWASSAFTEGGLKQISAEDMEQVLAAKVYGVRFGVADGAYVLTGATRTDDLDTQLQVLAAYLVEPGWRPEAFQRIKGAARTIHDQHEATASGVLGRDLPGLLHAGDARWRFPSREEMAGAKLADLEVQVAPALASGPVEVVIVGDITVEKATDAVARTFGALPPRPAEGTTPDSQRDVRFPTATQTPRTLTHKGRSDQAVGYIAWPTTGFFADPQRARETAVLGEVLRLRLIEELREAQGTTYSPSVGYAQSTTWPGWGYVSASIEAPPEKLEGFFGDVRRIAADLRARPVSADELERARKPRLERLAKAQVTNQYWLSELSGGQGDLRRLDAIRQLIPGTEGVTALGVQRAAQTNLADDLSFLLTVRPQGR